MRINFVDRKLTNATSRITYCVILIAWLSASIYVFVVGASREINLKDFKNDVIEVFRSRGAAIYLKILLSFLVSLLFIGALKLSSTVFAYITIAYVVILTLVRSVKLLMAMGALENILSLPSNVASVIMMATIVFGIKEKVKISEISEIIKDSSNACLFYPYYLLISIFLHLILALFLGFGGLVIYFLMQMKDEEGNISAIVVFIHIINAVGLFCSFFLIIDTLHLTTSTAFITWYKIEDKNSLSHSEVHGTIYSALQYHFGTLCYGSSINSIFIEIKAIFNKLKQIEVRNASKNNNNNNSKKSDKFIKWICVFYLLSFPRILTMSSYNMVVMNGTDFYNSTKRVLDIVFGNIYKYLVLTYISLYLLIFGWTVIDTLLLLGYLEEYDSEDVEFGLEAKIASTLVIFTTSAVLLPLLSASISAIICSLDHEDKRHSVNKIIDVIHILVR